MAARRKISMVERAMREGSAATVLTADGGSPYLGGQGGKRGGQ